MPLRYSMNSDQRDFALKHGLFRLERVPYSFADYFILRRPELQHDPPFLKARRQPYNHPTLYVMPFTETYSSLLWCSSWILLGAVIGVAMLLRPGGSDGVDRAIAAIFFVQVIGILSFMGLAQRYTAEFFPFLVFAFLFFLRERPGSVPLAIPAYRVGRRLGCYKLAHDGVLACGSRHECACGNAGQVE